MKQQHKTKWCFESNIMNKFISSMINKNREKIQISNIKSQQMVLVTDTRKILQIQM